LERFAMMKLIVDHPAAVEFRGMSRVRMPAVFIE
jgi:hypothetical protein